MKWEEFIKIVGELPVIETELLLAGVFKPDSTEVQISRWKKAGRLIQLKRGVYLLSKPYRKVEVWEPYLASLLKSPSYISLEKALEYHDLIPEAVAVYTSVTTKRAGRFFSRAGTFVYRHIKPALFWGYRADTLNKQTAFIASPEKALLDLLYLKRVRLSMDFLRELRLQNVEKINFDKLCEYAARFKKPAISNSVGLIGEYMNTYTSGEKLL